VFIIIICLDRIATEFNRIKIVPNMGPMFIQASERYNFSLLGGILLLLIVILIALF